MEIDILGTTLRMLLSLGVTLGITGVLLYLFRRSPLAMRFGQPRKDLIQVLARCPLSPREALCLVKVGEEVVLLGLSGSQITLLLRLPEGLQTPDSRSRTLEQRDRNGQVLLEGSSFPIEGEGSGWRWKA